MMHEDNSRILPPEAFGIDPQQIYDYRALPYWQQYTTDEFIRTFYHDVVNKQGITLGFMAILRDDPQLADLKISDTYSIRDAFDAILRSTDETIRFLDLAKTILLQAARAAKSAEVSSHATSNGADANLSDEDDEIIT
jgi:hypothetical protein